MDIVKEPSSKVRIHFFKNTNHPNWYFVKNFNDRTAEHFYLCSHHLPPHEESGYMDLPVEWAFALEIGEASSEKYLQFIRDIKGIRYDDPEQRITSWIGSNGWYEFKEKPNSEKWLDEFYEHRNQRRQELLKASTNGMQTALF